MAVRLEVHTQATRSGARGPLVYEFDQARVSIGRGSSSDVQLPDPTVSLAHASLRVHQTGYAAFDEGSTNGVYVNGTRIAPGRPKPIRSGDVLHVGGFAVVVEVALSVSSATSTEQTAAMAKRLARELLEGRGTTPDAPRVTVLNGPSAGQKAEIPEPPATLTVGRAETCGLPLSDADLSREHALIRRGDDGVWVEDLGSKNGLKVNGRVIERRRLRDRDEIEIGRTALFFEDPEVAALRAIEKESDAERTGPLLDYRGEVAGPAADEEAPDAENEDIGADRAEAWVGAVPAS
ncbi:MAG: FHA domain-containing protein, partial [Polyangiaceae bacterium]|nr:FHA domain-containing protein [Polyangiaceae bacterium]